MASSPENLPVWEESAWAAIGPFLGWVVIPALVALLAFHLVRRPLDPPEGGE